MLQGAGCERRNGPSHRGFFLHGRDDPFHRLNGFGERQGIAFTQKADLAPGLELAGVFIKIIAGGNALPLQVGELGVKKTAGLLETSLEVPVTAAAECPTCTFPLHQQSHSHGLHTPRGQAPGHLLPQQRRQGVSHQTVQDASRLLGMHEFHIQLTGLVKSPANRLLGDLVKHHAFHRNLRCKQLQQMPADAFTLSVFISRQQKLVSTFESVLQLLDRFFLVLRHHVKGLEIRLGVHAEIGPLLALLRCWNLTGVVREIAHMPHGGFHPEVLGKESTDGAGLGGALNDDQGVRQKRADNRSLLYRTAAPVAANTRDATRRNGSAAKVARTALPCARHARDGCLASRHPAFGSAG